jgi:hypothetical protein
LLRACARDDARAALAALQRCQLAGGGRELPPVLRGPLRELETALVLGRPWRGAELARAVRSLRRARARARRPALPPLNAASGAP